MAYFNGEKVFFSPKIHISGNEPEGTIEITENGTHDVKDYAEAVVNVPTSSEPEPPTLLANFADNTWENIIWACQNNAVPATWNVGDKKTLTFDYEPITIGICGKNVNQYADGGNAPLTFCNTNGFYSQSMCNIGESYFDGNMDSFLAQCISWIDNQNVKSAIRAVLRTPNLIANDYSVNSSLTIPTAEKLWLFTKNEAQQRFGTRELLGLSNSYWLRDQEAMDVYWFMTTDGGNFYQVMDDMCTSEKNVLFGFCF